MTTASRATELLALHQAPELLTVVNVWDAISAKVVSDTEGTKALATASHSIAATLGYPDGEKIPVDGDDRHVPPDRRADVDCRSAPTSRVGTAMRADTIRRAIGVGVVGANLEDQMKPLAEAVAQVEAVMKAAAAEGVPDFVLNARTDAFHLGRDRDPGDVLADAVERGKAFLDAGAPVVFVPAILTEERDRHAGRRLRPAAAHHHRASPARRHWSVSRSSAWPASRYGPLLAERRPHRPAGARRGGPARRRRPEVDADPQLGARDTGVREFRGRPAAR